MCVETLRTVLIFLRRSIWGVTCLGLLWKWTFCNLSPLKPNKFVLKPSEQCSVFQDDRFEGSHVWVYSKNYIVTLLHKRSFVSRISPGINHLSMSRPLWWSFSVVQLLELHSAYFGRYCRNWFTFTALQMYPQHLYMIYCKLDILLKMVSYKVMTIEN